MCQLAIANPTLGQEGGVGAHASLVVDGILKFGPLHHDSCFARGSLPPGSTHSHRYESMSCHNIGCLVWSTINIKAKDVSTKVACLLLLH